MERFAIVGFGCAGYHALAQIRENGCAAHIDVYSDTDMPPYNPMLTTYCAFLGIRYFSATRRDAFWHPFHHHKCATFMISGIVFIFLQQFLLLSFLLQTHR